MKSIYRTNGTVTEWYCAPMSGYPDQWESVYTGSAEQYLDSKVDNTIALLPTPPAGYSYGKSNPPGGNPRPPL